MDGSIALPVIIFEYLKEWKSNFLRFIHKSSQSSLHSAQRKSFKNVGAAAYLKMELYKPVSGHGMLKGRWLRSPLASINPNSAPLWKTMTASACLSTALTKQLFSDCGATLAACLPEFNALQSLLCVRTGVEVKRQDPSF